MKIIVLVTVTLVAANFETTIKKEVKDTFASALSSMVTEFYVKQSNTISISKYSTNRLGIMHSIIIGNILSDLGTKVSIAWTINDNPYLNRSVDFINNLIFIDTYGSWR